MTLALERLEVKLDSIHDRLHAPGLGDTLETRSDPPWHGFPQLASPRQTQRGPPTPMVVRSPDTAPTNEELAIPLRHSTAPQNILLWPCCTRRFSLLELRYPVTQEIARPLLNRYIDPPQILQTSMEQGVDHWLDRLSMGQLRMLTSYYFKYFHPHALILDEALFHSHFLATVVQSGFNSSIETCLVLLVLACGTVAAVEDGQHEWAARDIAAPGLGFFNAARQIYDDAATVDWPSVQCLLLMGSVNCCPQRHIEVRLICLVYSSLLESACTIIGLLSTGPVISS